MLKLRHVAAAGAAAALSLAWSPEAAAEKFVFPYNHPDLDWHTIETEHFFVHYPVSKDQSEDNPHAIDPVWSARKIAKVSEEMWAPMCAQFNYYLKEKIHVVLLDQSDYLEGFTIPSWDWIEISANPGGYFYRMRGRMEWFSDVMVHEFAHVVSLKAESAWGEGAGGVLLRGLYTDGISNTSSGVNVNLGSSGPFWWTEGGAEYWSDNTGYNWWSSSRDMNIRTTVLEDRLLTYDEWVTRIEKRDWGDGERGYQQGYSIALYLRERFGDETFAQFALESQKGWHGDWEKVIEEVLGIPLRQLYDDWVAYLTEKYDAVYDRVKAEGEVAGYELSPTRLPWDYTDADGRDEWLEDEPGDREDAKEATGTWDLEFRVSDDGRWWGVNSRASILAFEVQDEDYFYPFNGGRTSTDSEAAERMARMTWGYRTNFMHGWDFLPGRDALVHTGNESSYEGWLVSGFGGKPEFDGYDWKQLWIVDMNPHETEEEGEVFETIAPEKVIRDKNRPLLPEQVTPIPNTLRGSDPAASPTRDEIVYFEYGDGTLNLVRINLDGTDKTYLTDTEGDHWLQRADWSPDGEQIVFAIFRNFQQDLYIINRDGTGLKAITWDGHEEQDAYWAADGSIYFSSDPSGIFNIFRYDLDTGKITQLTNVIGGAQCPVLTPEGNLVFTMFTAHGWKIHGLDKDQFFNADATDQFITDIPTEEVEAVFAFSEDMSMFEELTTPYKSRKAFMPPTGAPILSLENSSQTDWDLQAGMYLYAQDLVEDHNLYFEMGVGKTTYGVLQWQYHGWHPDFFLIARHYRVKYDLGYLTDEDGDNNTVDDKAVFEIKNTQIYNLAGGGLTYPINNYLSAVLFGGITEVSFASINDLGKERYLLQGYGVVGLTYSKGISYWRGRMNPRNARIVDFTYQRGYTDVVYEPYYGVIADDGEKLDAYHYNSFQFRWTEHIAIPDLLNRWRERPERDPTLQVDFQLGVIDRNVMSWDEFRAGGRHPYYYGYSPQGNSFFAGYPGSSLSGETMALVNLAYRFPVLTKMNKKVGPAYFYDIYGQVFGTAGNLWSYRPPTEAGTYYTNRFDDRIAYDPEDIQREVPFADYSYKNSPQECTTRGTGCNFMLFDVGAEVRVGASLFNRGTWDSFIRVAYGLNDIPGTGGDVDGDGLIDGSDSALGDSLSNEVEPGSLRVYVGIGTGW